MAKVVTSKSVLKQRLKRFFHGNNTGRQQVRQLCDVLLSRAPVYLFGGAIRDIALNGIDKFYSDIDLVVDCSQIHLDQLLSELVHQHKLLSADAIKQNKFGGYRVTAMKWLVDIWPLERTWAFAKGIVPYGSVSSLLNTTVLNWDAVMYDFSQEQLICSDHYINELNAGHLALNLIDNPNPKGQAVRILRTMFEKEVRSITPELARYLTRLIHLYGETALCDYEKSSYRSCYLHSGNWPILYHQLNQTGQNDKIAIDLLQKNMFLL